MESLHISGPDYYVSLDMLSDKLGESLADCLTQGQDALPMVQYVLESFTVTCSEDDAKAFLRPYGAWDDDELTCHETNLERLVWLIGCDLAETGESYLSTY